MSQASVQPHAYQPASAVPAKRSFSQPNLALPKNEATADEVGLDFDWGFDELFPEDTTPFRDEDTSHPELSLKLIIWHPAVHVKTPLPSTSEESQTYTLTPIKTGEDGPSSKYFIGKLTTQIEVNVRQTAEWDEVKDDPIFVKFAASSKFVPVHIVRLDRDRPALDKHRGPEVNAIAKSPDDKDQNAAEAAQNEEVVEDVDDPTHGDEAMDMDSDDEDEEEEEEEPRQDAPGTDTTMVPNLLDNLEQALGADGETAAVQPVQVVKADAKSDSHGDRKQGGNKSRAKRRRSQQSNGSHSECEKPRSTRQRIKGPYGPHHQPPPPSGPPPDYNPWKAFEADSRGAHSPESTASQHTTVASPLRQDEDDSNTPAKTQQAPIETTNSGRKRGYDDFSRSSGDGGRRRQEADHPKRKRQPPYVPDVYRCESLYLSFCTSKLTVSSRRW